MRLRSILTLSVPRQNSPPLVQANRQCYRDRFDWDSKLYERLLFGKRFVTLVRLLAGEIGIAGSGAAREDAFMDYAFNPGTLHKYRLQEQWDAACVWPWRGTRTMPILAARLMPRFILPSPIGAKLVES